jgi:hypothetical protein
MPKNSKLKKNRRHGDDGAEVPSAQSVQLLLPLFMEDTSSEA